MKLYIHQEIRVIYVILGDMCKDANIIALEVQLNCRLYTAHGGDKVCQKYGITIWNIVHEWQINYGWA